MRPEPETRANLPLAVSMSDPAGIGLEIVLKAWSKRSDRGLDPFALFGDPEAVAQRARKLGLAVPIETIASPGEAMRAFGSGLPVISVPLAAPARPGIPDAANAPAVIASIEAATAAVASG